MSLPSFPSFGAGLEVSLGVLGVVGTGVFRVGLDWLDFGGFLWSAFWLAGVVGVLPLSLDLCCDLFAGISQFQNGVPSNKCQ